MNRSPKVDDPSKAVIFFDLGWTLEDESQAQWQRALEVAAYCRPWGFAFDAETLIRHQRRAGTRGEASVHTAALRDLGLTALQITELKQTFSWQTAGLRLFDGVAAMLAALSTRYSLGIIANQSRPISERLAAYGIDGFFRWVLCSCELGCEKPDAAIFSMAEEQCGLDPGRIWMVGDRVDNDIAPARQRGWKTVRIRQGDHAGYNGTLAMETADFTVADIDELPAILMRPASIDAGA